MLLRSIVGAQAKVPIEQLYLETASLTPTQIISIRRMIYLQTILKRPNSELIRKIYEEMKNDPIPGDWSELVKNDFEEINLHIDNKIIQEMDIAKYKTLIKKEVREAAFKEFKVKQSGHEKGNSTSHENLEKPQKYLLTNKLTNKQISLLFNLRCQSERTFKNNFHRQYIGNLSCLMCNTEIDSQEHIIKCKELKKHMDTNHTIRYDQLYGSLEEQIEVTKLYSSLLEVREQILEERSY